MTEAMIRTPLLLGIILAVLANAVLYMRWSPKSLMVTWTISLFFVPIWVGQQLGIFYSFVTVVTILVIFVSSPACTKWSRIDLLMASFTFLLIVGWLFDWIEWGHLLLVTTGWLIPYGAGRLVSTRVPRQWIYGCIAAGGVGASCLAIAEFATGVNIFVGLKMNNGLYNTWHSLQYRGGLLRVEGAFGHSIALGAALAMSSVFVLVVAWPQWLRLLSLVLIATATGMTFSRIGLIGFVVTVAFSLVALRREITAALRWKILGLLGTAAVLGLPVVWSVFGSAGEEASNSAGYRADLFPLLNESSLLGLAGSYRVTASGSTYFGSFRSIDSELVLTALRFGIVPLALLLLAILALIGSVLRDRATPASVAVLGMVPAFLTVAMITQYATLVWFLAGLAVATYPRSRLATPATEPVPATQPAMALSHGERPKWSR